MELKLTHPDPGAAVDPRAEAMLPAVGGFPASDRGLFLAGYGELCRIDLSGGRALEICGGAGKLASGLAAAFPEGEVTGLDLYVPDDDDVRERLRLHPNLSYVAGDAFDLSRYADGSLDLVFGQAALHHLAHDLAGLRRETLRVLKPGGRLVFIFEPLGHNPLFAAIRAWRFALAELGDESNLYLSQFEQLGAGFSTCEVQCFNLLGYPMKALSDRLRPFAEMVREIDHRLMMGFPRLRKLTANANLILTK
jgi:SAM-dependent methyltransferase